MRFHHLLPPPHLVPLLLTSVLAFAGGAFALMRARARAKSRGGESAHSAREDYRAATLKSLEAEADEFRKYLDALRRSRDLVDFEAFLDHRKGAAGGAH